MMHLYQATIPGLPKEFPPLRTLSAPVRVPAPPTSFVGRKDKVTEVLERLGETRLLTLTGPGGTGKTQLSRSRFSTSTGSWSVSWSERRAASLLRRP